MLNKLKLILALSLFSVTGVMAQTGDVGIGTSSPHASAVLDVTSTTKGFLPPRMTNAQMTAIASPATGLMVFCTDCSPAVLYIYNGSTWDVLGIITPDPTVVANCSVNGFVGEYISGNQLSGATFTTTLTNNSYTVPTIYFSASDLVLSGVSGVTVGTPTPTSATINAGQSQIVSYPISGTPSSTGTLTGTWNKLSLSCSDTQSVSGLGSTINDVNYCSNASINGIYAANTAFNSSNTFTVTFTNNSGSTINGLPAPSLGNLDINYSGTGSITVASVSPSGTYTLAAGASRTFTYILSGTVTSEGDLTLNWTYSDLSCSKVRNVLLGDATFILPESNKVFSTYDGTPVVNIQGYITNNVPNQIIINVPYTNGVGIYDAYTSSVVTGVAGEGGDVNGFSISYPAGTFATSGSITVTVTVDGDGSYSALKQLFNVEQNIVTIPFLANGVNRGNIVLNVMGVIPDRVYGQTINGANNHNFVYIPITTADGKTWLSNNLGAHYANVNHASFDPIKQATSSTDHLAYGSLFQWGRKPDGHELINYSSGTSGVAVNGTTATRSNTPSNASFITNGSTPFDWRTSSSGTLWNSSSAINNPCPVGYRVPTYSELSTLISVLGITNTATAASSTMKFTAQGARLNSTGAFTLLGDTGNYWSITESPSLTDSQYLRIRSTAVGQATFYRAFGYAVRCIKD